VGPGPHPPGLEQRAARGPEVTSKLSRFLHLERARVERPESEASSQLQSGNRFESMEERKEHHETGVPDAHLERFRAQEPIAFADAPEEDARRFPRCMLCESENGRFAKTCRMCGADLGTPQQLEFNERLWQERRKELTRTRADESEALRQFEAQRRQDDAEQLARQLAQLRAEEGMHPWVRAFSQHSTLGTALLSLIPHPLIRWLTFAGAVGLSVGLWRYGHGRAQWVGGGLSLLLLLLFIPPKSRGWR
jgi:hypothetical protein